MLLIMAYIAANFFHAPTWVFVAIFALTALEFGFLLGRLQRRGVIYIHQGDGIERRHLDAYAENVRESYRKAKLPAPLVFIVPTGITVARRPN
jgi:hypothetical protein